MWRVSQGAGASVPVGRVEKLAALDAAFGRVQGGQPSTVLIGGEAGVGKSRLVSESAARARAAGAARVLSRYCLELSAEGLPFAPFTGVLRQLVREVAPTGLVPCCPAGVCPTLPGGGVSDLPGSPTSGCPASVPIPPRRGPGCSSRRWP